MGKPKAMMLIILLASIVLILVIYSLPKVVVSDDEADLEKETTEDVHIHNENQAEGPGEGQLGELRKYLDLEGGNANEAHFAEDLAALYLRMGFTDSALLVANNLYNEGYSLSGDWVKSRVFLDQMKNGEEGPTQTERADSALVYLDRVLENDPSDLGSMNGKAEALLFKGEVMNSVMLLKEIVEKDPDNVGALYQLGILSVQSGQLDKAVGRFEKIIENEPENVNAHYWLAYCLVNSGEEERGLEVAKNAMSLTDDPEVQAALGSLVENI